VIEKFIGVNMAVLGFCLQKVFTTAEPAAGNGTGELNVLCAGIMSPAESERVDGSFALEVDGLRICGGWGLIERVFRDGARESEVEADYIPIRSGVIPADVDALGLRALEWALHAGRQAGTKKCVERGKREGAARA